jgi:tRNA (guanine-N7-)-methyltransferase
MRKKKNLDARLERCAAYLISDPREKRGHWRDLMPSARQLRLELGCGKGRFTVETAARNPDVLFIAIERVADALVMSMERAMERELSNVFFICDDAANLSEFFADGEIDLLYINFCDPWPSKKHAKRRLVHEGFLRSYRQLLPDGGQLHFKTDNKPLFQFSLTQFPRAGYELSEVTFDLHQDDPDVVMTDFEAVFHEQGTKINRCVGTKIALPEQLGEEPLQSLLDYWVEGEPIPRGMDEEALLQRVKEKKEAAEQAAQQS